MAVYFGSTKIAIGLNDTLSNTVRNQSRTVTPSTSSQTLIPDPGYTGMSQVVVNAIPNSYIVPSGTLSISANNTYNVKSYASISVNLPYYEAYRSLVTNTYINANNSYLTEYLNSLSRIFADQFAGKRFDGSFTFENVTHVDVAAFGPTTTGGGGTTGGTSCYFSFPKLVSTIDGFWCSYGIRELNAPNLEYIQGYNGTFRGCTGLSSIFFPKLSYISGYSTFSGCTGASIINLPSLTEINGSGTFKGCTSLSSISLPLLSLVSNGTYTFDYCTQISYINLPSLITINDGTYFFARCYKLESINLPVLTTINGNASYMFASCSKLKTISFPNLISINGNMSYMFASCSTLSAVYFPKLETVDNILGMFYYCSKLESVYFTGPQVISVSTLTNVFYGTPIYSSSYLNGRYGSIYVRSSLLTAYQTATGWSSYSSRFVGV